MKTETEEATGFNMSVEILKILRLESAKTTPIAL